MNRFERKFIVNTEGEAAEQKLNEREKKSLNKPKAKDMLSMTDGGSLVRKGQDGKIKEVLVEGEKRAVNEK